MKTIMDTVKGNDLKTELYTQLERYKYGQKYM